jgi:8-oxo-(d)GTP phosphatase
LPKGKPDRDEWPVETAVREVQEETGLRVRLGPPLGQQTYPLDNGDLKAVDYWMAQARGDDSLTSFVPNDEVDDVRWLSVKRAREQLTYPCDRKMVRGIAKLTGTSPLLVLRHTEARNRKRWKGPDIARTLTEQGQQQADRLVPRLEAFGVRRIVSSNAVRCVMTVQPFADRNDAKLIIDTRLSEEYATKSSVREVMSTLLASSRRSVVCSHRPVLPWIFETLGVQRRSLPPGGFVVLHRRNGELVAVDHIVDDDPERYG